MAERLSNVSHFAFLTHRPPRRGEPMGENSENAKCDTFESRSAILGETGRNFGGAYLPQSFGQFDVHAHTGEAGWPHPPTHPPYVNAPPG